MGSMYADPSPYRQQIQNEDGEWIPVCTYPPKKDIPTATKHFYEVCCSCSSSVVVVLFVLVVDAVVVGGVSIPMVVVQSSWCASVVVDDVSCRRFPLLMIT